MKVDPAIVLKSHPLVYVPSDDSYLLLDSIGIAEGQEVLEIGTGSGLIALHCATVANVTATDINPHAVSLARKNADLNGLKLHFIRCDLFQGIRGSFDVIIFNPPYLRTEEERRENGGWLEGAWGGGRTGEETALEFLHEVKDFMGPCGKVYLLLSMDNKGALDYIGKNFGFRKLSEKHLFFERIAVFALSK